MSGVHSGAKDIPGGSPEAVRIKLLGGFRISVGSRTINDDTWRLRKAAALVKLLALAPNHRLHREQAMEYLWPDLSPKAAANNLRVTLHAARRILDPDPAVGPRCLVFQDEQLALCPEVPLWVDVDAFEEAVAAARRAKNPAVYRMAIELYAGELLPTDRYEEWVQNRMEALRSSYLALFVEWAALHEERGEFAPAIEALKQVVAEEPTHDEYQVGLMRLYALSGQHQAALRHYERIREAFARRFGAEPDAISRHLYHEIAAERFPLTPSPSNGRPLKELSRTYQHNLPTSLTSFIGREQEMLEVKRELAITRLLTLTGTGGCGKTRLALEVARDLAGAYPDGAWLTELAELSEPSLTPQAVAKALGVREQPGRSLADTLVDALRRKQLLLVLDSCEHLIDACALLAKKILSSCPHVRILATSREALNVPGEINWRVPSLSVADTASSLALDTLMRSEAVRLFAERARSRSPAFVLGLGNVRAVADICRRLDGVPLAIELAAARVGPLSVGEISRKLDDSLEFLSTGVRTAAPKDQTLRGTLDWSHRLLTEAEQKLFRRLSVFAGGWSLAAAEAVAVGGGIKKSEVLDLLSRLVDKSLVVAVSTPDVVQSNRLLEPIRQYGRERLEDSGEADSVLHRHADFYLALAEQAETGLNGVRQQEWLERLEVEHDNLRAALSWALEHNESELAIRMAAALGEFWHIHGHLREGRRWLERALARQATLSEDTQVKALIHAGDIAWEQLDFVASTTLSAEALALSRKTGNKVGSAAALYTLGFVAMFQAKLGEASALLEECLALRRELGDAVGVGRTLWTLAVVAVARHNYGQTLELYEGSLALARETGDTLMIALSLGVGALAHLGRGDHGRARKLCMEGLELSWQLRHTHACAFHLHVLSVLAGSEGQLARSVRLWGAAEALLEVIGTSLSPLERDYYEPYLAAVRTQLDEGAWDAALRDGRAMNLEVALDYALRKEQPASRRSERAFASETPGQLTRREKEVAGLVAQGLTNRQIASEFMVSERTIDNHVANILKKLGLRSRAEVADRMDQL